MRTAKAVMIGRRSRAAGGQWEEMLAAACTFYHLRGLAEIEKTPEPIKQIGPKDRQGHFTAHYEKKAQPDYKGTLDGGRAIVFEAKHTDSDRMKREVISEEQEKRLNSHTALGAESFVMVSFAFRRFFKIPWAVFRDMKQHYGRKYITPEDVTAYEIPFKGGVLRFLEEGGENHG